MSGHHADGPSGHAFISYVHEDRERVDRLQGTLERAGVRVWRDTASLWPGQDWKREIRRAIVTGSLAFIACFSEKSAQKSVSYQNEELILAIEQMRLRTPGQAWLIPVRFAKCDIPDFDLGAGRTLGSLQRLDLFDDSWDRESPRLVAAVLGILRDPAWPSQARNAGKQPSGKPGHANQRWRSRTVLLVIVAIVVAVGLLSWLSLFRTPAPAAAPVATVSAPSGDLGMSVAVSGTTAVAGAPTAYGGLGAAGIYARSGRSWHLQTVLTDPHKTPDDFFGSNVAISRTAAGTFAVIGAYGTDGQAGAAYLYALSGQQWHLETTLTGTTHNQNLGKSVAVSGTTAIIGSWGTNNNNGVAYVYVRSGTTWHRQATLTPDRVGQILFGYSVAVSGPTAFVSAIHANNSEGLAYVFTRTGTAWREQAILIDPLGLPGDTFGNKVTISGSIAAISAAFTDNAAGAAYVFARSGSTWHLQASLSSANPASGDYFGDGVAVSGTTVLVGVPRAGLSRCGTAYEYTRSGATWRERAQLANPNCTTKDYFGFAVAVSGKTAMSGAPGKNNSAGEVYIQALP